MNSSGIKRGLAATAISALAVTGVPFLATSASATPIIADYVATQNGTVTAADLELLNPDSAAAPVTTSAYNLVAAGNTDVAQVLFQFSPTGAAPWTNIGSAVARVNGAFVQSWTPSVSGTVRAVPINASGDLFEAQAVSQTVNAVLAGNADTAKITGDTNTGVWNTKATTAAANAFTMGVTGTTSLTDTASPLDDGYRVVLDVRTGGTGTANADVVGAAAGTFAGVLPLTGYAFTPGGPDEIVVGAEPQDAVAGVDGARANVEDAAVKTLYLQQPGTVTAVADSANLQPGQTTKVTVTALDQNQKPIAGAQIYKSANGAAGTLVGTTGADGKLVDNNGGAGLGSGSYKYFINAPAAAVDNPQTSEEAALGDKSSTVAIAVYTPALTGVTVTSVYGSNADIDEVDPGTPFTAKAVDQNGNPMGAEQLYYTWTVDPFAPSAPTVTSNEITAAPTDNTATPAKGTTPIRMADTTDFTPAMASLPSGVWTLKVYRKPVGGIGAFNAAPVDFKFGESKVTWDPSDVQAAIAGSTTIKGTLSLEDGTAIGSIDRADTDPLGDVNRTASLSYVAGLEDDPTTPAVEALPGDSRIAPILEQDGTVTSVAAGGLTGAVKFNASGASNVKVNDATPETFEELNAALTADPTGALSVADGASDNATVQIDFLASVVANAVALDDTDSIDGFGATPGRPLRLEFKVTNASGQTLSNKNVEITVGNGGFVTPNWATTPVDPTLTLAQSNGQFANSGTTATVKTNGNGIAVVTVAIEKNAGFDDDFRHDVTVTASADGKSVSTTQTFLAQDAVNLDKVEITPSADNTANLPDAQVDFENVLFDVIAYDQFGNRTDESYGYDDAGNPRATLSDLSGDTQGALDPSDLEAAATSATSQVVTVNVLDRNGAAVDTQATDTADAINWYVVDFAASSFTLGQQGPESVPAGTRVTEVLTVLDQKSHPVRGLWVDFLRAGPGPEDSDGNVSDETNVDGSAFYDFTGGTAGTARISAIVKTSPFPGAARVGSADDTVTFTGDVTPEQPPVAIQAILKGFNNGAKADVLKVKAPAKARGAVVKLYKVVGGKRVLVGTKKLNAFGGVSFKVVDKNKNKFTKYIAVVGATKLTKKDVTNPKSVR